ncbi:MAG: hypothetical protein K5872_22605 [Rhizobiaceae bacterium]|nr:hypothetical protein [Rhizobiaceae bacterium]MCV0409014.1 hypothetical protein [Rhizobiaceae bacterium]
MNMSLERLFEGIVATLRSDVIPQIPDAYARGQAVGVIDLLNNIAPRTEWARQPVADAVAQKRALLSEVARLVPGAADAGASVPATTDRSGGTLALLGERDRLDAALGDAIAVLLPEPGQPEPEALGLIRAHLHDEMVRETKLTRKPLFAEIASGSGGEAKDAPEGRP